MDSSPIHQKIDSIPDSSPSPYSSHTALETDHIPPVDRRKPSQEAATPGNGL